MSQSVQKRPRSETGGTRLKKGRLTINHQETRTDPHLAPVHEIHHTLVHEPSSLPKRYQCHECPYQTNVAKDMQRHRERHEAAEFSCDLCNMPFRTRNHWTGHKRQVHGVGNVAEKFVKHCTLCPYTTLHSGDMARHKRKHTMTEFNCKFCNYPFANKVGMKAHIRKTHGETDEMNTKAKHGPRRDHEIHTKEDKRKVKQSVKETTNVNRFDARENVRHTSHSKDNRVKDTLRDERAIGERHTENKFRKHSGYGTGDREADMNENSQLRLKPKHEYYKKFSVNITDSKYDKSVNSKQKEHSKRRDHRKPLWCVKLKKAEKAEEAVEDNQKDSNCRSRQESLINKSDTNSSFLDDIRNSSDDNETRSDEGQQFPDEFETMTIFLEDNTSAKAMRCLKCVYLTTNSNLFQEHMEKHRHGSYECSQCKMPFLQQVNLDKHMESAHDVTDSEGNECDTSKESLEDFVDLAPLATSPITTEGKAERDKEINCAFCDFKTNSYHELKEHIVIHVEDETDVFSSGSDCDVGGTSQEIIEDQDDDSNEAQDDIGYVDVVTSSNTLTNPTGTEASDVESSDTLTEKHGSDDSQYRDRPSADVEHVDEMTFVEVRGYIANDKRTVKLGENQTLAGRLDKEDFKQTKKLYTKVSSSAGHMYECLVCTDDNMFKTAKSIWLHFKHHHKKLRRRVCSSCSYCSKPFPKLK